MGSGSGTNASAIIQYFHNHAEIEVGLVLTDQPEAGILNVAQGQSIPAIHLSSTERKDPVFMLNLMKSNDIQLIALAGYLRKLNSEFLKMYDGVVLNIHPALLPAFGGKGMYGIHVHKAVISSKAKESGITVHYVNEEYDKGTILFQKSIKIEDKWDAISLSREVLKLEHKYYPEIIASECKKITYSH